LQTIESHLDDLNSVKEVLLTVRLTRGDNNSYAQRA